MEKVCNDHRLQHRSNIGLKVLSGMTKQDKESIKVFNIIMT